MMSTWGATIPLSYFCMFKLFHNKMFFEKISALMWSFMESIDIKKRIFFFFVESCSQYIVG